jgi:hypothetical protein
MMGKVAKAPLTKSDKSEQGQECAISHPLPVNPDGTPMSEMQYKAFKGIKEDSSASGKEKQGGGGRGGRRKSSQGKLSVKEEPKDDDAELSDYGGMSEYDLAS